MALFCFLISVYPYLLRDFKVRIFYLVELEVIDRLLNISHL